MKRIVNIGVLVSGSGSNLQSIIDSIHNGKLDARIRIVISNNAEAYALKRAEANNIPTAVIDHRQFNDRDDFEMNLIEILNSHQVELVVLAGFMRILSSLFLDAFPMRVMNIHPALLPSFQGIHGQTQAYDYGVKFSGCTVHFADAGIDTGPIIIQAVVPVFDNDTADSLQQRILKEEHRIYPQAIQFFAEGRVVIEGRKVRVINSRSMEESSLHNPLLEDF
ncbi:MAG: phosphoribosylglycinamide formyltransferase [Syntrophales bacterium]|jgi:phosphoribosylglycinamide formyltransferase-1|nr:phosphoribosylglycinamide formyltransferase [Syntrophales bacterium]MDY0044166.1 phosphoribosylglycinamide formyltransferase [Syntrophales bacterium]